MTTMVNDRQIIISNPISMKQVSYGFWSLIFSHSKISTMNRFTRSLRGGLLAFMAIWLVPQKGFSQCSLIVSGATPVNVNITLNGTTGTSTMSGANVSSFVSSGDPGCGSYFFSDENYAPIGQNVAFGCADIGTHTFFVQTWDGADPVTLSSDYAELNVSVQDKTAPVLFCPNVLSAFSADDDCALAADPATVALFKVEVVGHPADDWGEASDNCEIDQFFYSKSTVSQPPAGTTQVGSLGNPTFLFPFLTGTTYVAYTVKDKSGNSKSCNFIVEVEDLEPPTIIGTYEDTLVSCGAAIPQIDTLIAFDNCDLDTLLISSSIGQDSDVDVCGHYTYDITQTWEAVDEAGNRTAQYSRIVTVADTTAPAFDFPATLLVETEPLATSCAATVALDLLWGMVDDCAHDSTLLFSNQVWKIGSPNTLYAVGDGAASASGDYDLGQYMICFSAEDPCNNVGADTLFLTVLDGTSPLVACQTQINVALNNLGMAQIGVGQVLAGFPTDNCSDISFLMGTAAVSPTDFTCANLAAPVTVTLTVEDESGNENSCTTQVFTQDNTAPTIVCPADVTFSCSVDPASIGAPTVSDACTTSPLVTFSETTVSNGPNCFVRTRIWTAADASGNSANCAQTITVEDFDAPVLSGVPTDTALVCGSTVPAASVTASDACAGAVGVTVSTQTLDFDCSADDYDGHPLRSTVVRTWTATDACGNVATASQIVFFIDTIAPSLQNVPTELNFYTLGNACAADVELDMDDYAITDDCSLTIVRNGSFSTPSAPIGSFLAPISAIDECGNESLGEILIHVLDTVTPQIICQNAITVTLSNNGYATIEQNDVLISSSDNCSIASIVLSTDTLTCADASLEWLFGPTQVVVTATDANGNVAECVVFVDVEAPAGLGVAIDNLTTTDPTFFGAADGTASIGGVSGGSGHYFYAFFDGFLDPIGDQSTIGGLEAGFYWAGVQDSVTTCIDLIDFTLEDGAFPHFVVDSIGGASGDTACIAVTVEDFKNIVSVEMDLSVLDPQVAEVLEIQNAQPALFDLSALGAGMIGNDFTVSILSDGLVKRNLADGDTLFLIKVILTGGLADTTSVLIDSASIEVSTGPGPGGLIPATFENGFVAITSGLPDALVEGKIFPWWDALLGCGQAEVDLNNGQDAFTTAADGFYDFSVNNGQPATVTPFKNQKWANGVDVLDLVIIQQHILGNPAAKLEGYRYVAADATGDEKITTFDLVELLYVILNPDSALTGTTSWRFVDAKFAFPNTSNPFSTVFPENISFLAVADSSGNDFVAIKTGDVTGEADPTFFGSPAQIDDRSPAFFEVQNRAVKKGETVKIDFSALGFFEKMGWQMTLGWDAQLLDFQRVTPNSSLGLTDKNFGQKAVENGQLTAAWFSPAAKSLLDGTSLFSIEFLAKKDAPSLEGLLSISSDRTSAFAADEKGQRQALALAFAEKTAAPALVETLRARPNPMTEATTIEYVVPVGGEKDDAVWSVFDATGRAVKTGVLSVETGSNFVRLDRSDLPTAGTFFFEIRTSTSVKRQQIVVVE